MYICREKTDYKNGYISYVLFLDHFFDMSNWEVGQTLQFSNPSCLAYLRVMTPLNINVTDI